MWRFLKSLFAPVPAKRLDPEQHWATVAAMLAEAAPSWGYTESQNLCAHLRAIADADAFDLERLRALLQPWYERNPIIVEWVPNCELRVRDPLYVEISDAALDDGDRGYLQLQPFAAALRCLHVVDDGPTVFHHGFSAADLLAILRDPNAPVAEAFVAHGMVDYRPSDLSGIIDCVTSGDRMRNLRHLGLSDTAFGPDHVARVARSERACQLLSLDISERLCDGLVDDEAGAIKVLGAMSNFTRLEHLGMYNNLNTAEHLRAFAANLFPSLTHLSIGHVTSVESFAAALRRCDAFPKLQRLYLPGAREYLADWAQERGITVD